VPSVLTYYKREVRVETIIMRRDREKKKKQKQTRIGDERSKIVCVQVKKRKKGGRLVACYPSHILFEIRLKPHHE